jgi:hypothetical protein
MKNILFILLILGSAHITFAQHSFSLGFGFPATQKLAGKKTDLTPKVLGPFNLAYQYQAKTWLNVGAGVTYVKTTLSEGTKFNYVSLVGRADFQYVNKPNYKLYSGLSLGGAYQFNADCAHANPALHLLFMGIKYSFTNFGVFTEIGYGINGVVNSGVTYKF